MKRLFAIILSAILVFHPTWVMVAYAEGEEEQLAQVEEVEQVAQVEQVGEAPETPETPEISQETSADPTPTDTPSSTIQTGDATSQATTETTANYSETCLKGEIEVGDCGGTGEAESSLVQENTAEATSSAQATSTSGENTNAEPEGTAEIDTGTATSEATTEDVINTNVVDLVPTDFPDSPDLSADSADNPDSPGQEDPAVIVHDNEADVDSSAQAESTSGENEAVGGAGASVETDTSHASANIVDLINTNIIGSNFEFLFKNIEDYEGDINLNEIWKALLAEKGAEASATLFSDFLLLIANFNQANVQENVNAQATSGNNTAISGTGPAEITSGDSFASANLFRFINTNIVGSDFLFAIINIFGNLTGNIVLPSQEKFMEMNGNLGDLPPIIFTNNNFAQIDDRVLATAVSGENFSATAGNQETETGQAIASANSINFANTNFWQSYWYWLFLNNFGDWQGKILGWEEANSSGEPVAGTTQLTLNNNGNNQETGEGQAGALSGAENQPNLAVYNQNWAEVEGFVTAEAKSGGNTATSLTGNTKIKTGRAVALANLFSWVNTNILGGRFILPIINIFGRWGGNLVFAYPDLTVSLSDGLDRVYPGDILDYTLVYQNQGYEEARNGSVTVDLPAGVSYVLTKGGPEPVVNSHSLTYFVGNLAQGQGGSFVIEVQVDQDFITKNGYHTQRETPSLLASIFAKIVRPATAAEDGTEYEVAVSAEVTSTDGDSNPDNNFAVSNTRVFISNGEGQEGNSQENENLGGPDVRLPALYLSSWNNVGEFVYPEDIVTFEVNLVNRGDGPAGETVVYQEIYNGDPLSKFTNSFYIGDVEINQTIKLSFGLQVPAEVKSGTYYSKIWAVGKAPAGDNVSSGESLTNFEVRLPRYGITKDIQAAEPVEPGQVAGNQATCPPCEQKKDPLPYILLLLLGSLWFTDRFKRKENKKDIGKAIKKFKGRLWKKIDKNLKTQNSNVKTTT